MKIGIVGAGIFGATTAWYLAQHGFEVDLFEKENDILCAASGINQYRLHRGYHYPRSLETAILSKQEEASFLKQYRDAAEFTNEHYYCISKRNSLSTPEECQEAWSKCGLEFRTENSRVVDTKSIAWSARVKESLFDPQKLRNICWDRLKKWNVNVKLNHEVTPVELEDYDLVILATYAYNNHFMDKVSAAKKNYQYELCEKLVLELPPSFEKQSVVIMDGPFMCIDPLGETGYFVMGNVVHAIHKTNIGIEPIIPDEYKPLLNKGIIKNPSITNFSKFIESAKEFFPEVVKAKHVGSMYTIRTVPPYRDHDDARPTIVEKISDRVVSVFSGKIGTCVGVAEQVLDIAKDLEIKDKKLNGYH